MAPGAKHGRRPILGGHFYSGKQPRSGQEVRDDGVRETSSFARQPHIAFPHFEQPTFKMSRKRAARQLAQIQAGLFAKCGKINSLAAPQPKHDELAGPFFR